MFFISPFSSSSFLDFGFLLSPSFQEFFSVFNENIIYWKQWRVTEVKWKRMPKALIPSLSLELCYNCYKVPQVVDCRYFVWRLYDWLYEKNGSTSLSFCFFPFYYFDGFIFLYTYTCLWEVLTLIACCKHTSIISATNGSLIHKNTEEGIKM
jgi:hypothetical protein